MPRPVRELWNGLGASPGEGDDLLVVDADALALESVFGAALTAGVVVRVFSDEAFGFSAPEELAALGVFWAPHLETSEQLRAAITDAQDRLKRKLNDEITLLERLGFSGELRAPVASSRGCADIGGQRLEVALGPGGELLLERVEGGDVPADQREVLRDASGVSRQEAQDKVVEHANTLLEAGVVEPAAAAEAAVDERISGEDSVGFEEQNATRQVTTAALLGDDPGTELVPPPSDDDDALSAAERDELAAALRSGELLGDSLEGAAVDDEEPAHDDVGAAQVQQPEGPERGPLGKAVARDEAQAGDAHEQGGADDDDDEEVETHEIAGTAGSTAADLDEGFVRPKTAPALESDTKAPDSFDDFPPMVTEQMSIAPPVAPSHASRSIEDDGFNAETGEEVLLSLSGDDGVMPSPAEATALRPAPTATELSLDDEAGALPALDDDDDAEPTVTAARESLGSSDEAEHTLAKAQVFHGRKGPSLVSSGSAGSSVDDAQEHQELAAPEAADGDAAAAVAEASAVPEVPLVDDSADEQTAQRAVARSEIDVEEPASAALERLDAEPTDPSLGVLAREQPGDAGPSLDLDVEVAGAVAAPDLDASDEGAYATGEIARGARESAAQTALASLMDDHAEEQTQAEAPRARSDERLDALAAIVGEGMSSGKTGAIVLDADAFAYLREQAGEGLPPGEDPDALEREAEQLESKARELRAKAELLRERATAPVSRRKLASALEKARALRDDGELLGGSASLGDRSALGEDLSAPSDEVDSAFAPEAAVSSDDAFTSQQELSAEPLVGGEESAPETDAFADGVALEDVRAMLAAERVDGASDLYAATQLAEMDLGDLRQASQSDGGVFEGGVHDADDEPAFDLEANTNRAHTYPTSMGSLPQVASADVHALPSRVQPSLEAAAEPAEGALESESGAPTQAMPMPALRPPPEARAAKRPALSRSLALVVSDPRARERLKKHLEEMFPRVVELANAREAATLSAAEVQAVVIVRPVHDDATVSGLQEIDGNDTRPPVLVLSSDASFDGLPGVDLRLALGRRASEVARQVVDGLTTLGVRASA